MRQGIVPLNRVSKCPYLIHFLQIDSSEVSPEALDAFGIPWEWESVSQGRCFASNPPLVVRSSTSKTDHPVKPQSRGGWIIVRQELSTTLYERLAEHTRRSRQRLLPAPGGHGHGRRYSDPNLVEVKVNDRERDKIYLVRRKSRGRMARMFPI